MTDLPRFWNTCDLSYFVLNSSLLSLRLPLHQHLSRQRTLHVIGCPPFCRKPLSPTAPRQPARSDFRPSFLVPGRISRPTHQTGANSPQPTGRSQASEGKIFPAPIASRPPKTLVCSAGRADFSQTAEQLPTRRNLSALSQHTTVSARARADDAQAKLFGRALTQPQAIVQSDKAGSIARITLGCDRKNLPPHAVPLTNCLPLHRPLAHLFRRVVQKGCHG